MQARWCPDGKFFRSGTERIWVRAVTYGPFPGGWPARLEADLERIAAAGFNALRLYEMPEREFLDVAWRQGLRVFGGLQWGQHADFFRCPSLRSGARVSLAESLAATASHPALAAVLVGNEIPTDLVRWMGPTRVRVVVEELIALGRQLAPALMFGYANYPSTEYLEPENADFTAFNIYLEDLQAFRKYLKRLHHIAGDRPLIISEFGMDSRRNGFARQAEVLRWAMEIARDEETAGMTLFAWSDRWLSGGIEVLDWDFGLTDRNGAAKPALAEISACCLPDSHRAPAGPSISVIICTRDGRQRIGACLTATGQLETTGLGSVETIVVDDGSRDGTADWVKAHFPNVRLIKLNPAGLSAARNAGAAAAAGEILAFTDDDCQPDREWLLRLARGFSGGQYAAIGGPNLPPAARNWQQAVVRAAPGAPSHVLIDDTEAEHLPGCNLAVTKQAFEAVGGFDPLFVTAGDDVDFCWRLRAAGFRLGFVPGAFVWHWRRPTITRFLLQQIGYGRAEKLLMAKHPQHFSIEGSIQWDGFIYGGGPVRVLDRSILYHGPMGSAGYQSVCNRMLPLRGIEARFDGWRSRNALRWVRVLVPALRAWARGLRCPRLRTGWKPEPEPTMDEPDQEFEIAGIEREEMIARLLADAWLPAGDCDSWDLERHQSRVLLATERFEMGGRRTLVRLWGEPQDFPR
jgi:GT2 family glycosyltransferase